MASQELISKHAQERALMPPPPPRSLLSSALPLPGDQGLAKAVLPEDDYTEGVAAIIERDYFPDIPKLRNQLEWAQAVKTGDPTIIRQAQINIAHRRAGLATPRPHTSSHPSTTTPGLHSAPAAATPSGWGVTPALGPVHTPSMTPLVGLAGHPGATPMPGATPNLRDPTATPGAATAAAMAASAPVQQLKAPPMNLDTFLATHTSEDNASFAKLQAKDIERKKRRVAHHLVDNNQPLLLEGPQANPTEGYGTSSQQPLTLVSTTHNPTNALYYPPDQKPLSIKEVEALANRPGKTINIRGTRLKPLVDEDAGAKAVAAAVAAAAGGATGVRGPGGEFSRLATPAFTPGMLGESPLMTWGDIAGTPLRLEGEDDLGAMGLDPGGGAGPRFSVPALPKREAVGHQLAAAKTIKEFKKRQREQKESEVLAAALPAGAGATLMVATGAGTTHRMTGLRTGSVAGTPVLGVGGRPGTGGVPPRPGTGGGVGGMSEAAQKLAKQLQVQKARATGVGMRGRTPADVTDRMLRASYSAGRGTPGVGVGTPTGVGLKGVGTPGVGVGLKSGGAAVGGATPGRRVVVVGGGVGAGANGEKGAQGKSITDDLLNL